MAGGVSSLFSVPEGQQRLAGGGARDERNPRNTRGNAVRPEGGARNSQPASRAAFGAHSVFAKVRGFRSRLAPPPANFCCPSGTLSRGEPREKRAKRFPESRLDFTAASQYCFSLPSFRGTRMQRSAWEECPWGGSQARKLACSGDSQQGENYSKRVGRTRGEFRVARSSRVLVLASRQNGLYST